MIKKILRFVLSVCICVGLVFPIVTEINKPIEVEANVLECFVEGGSKQACMRRIIQYGIMSIGIASKGSNQFDLLVDDVMTNVKDFVFDERYGVSKNFETKSISLTREGMSQLYKDIYDTVPLAKREFLKPNMQYNYASEFTISPSYYIPVVNPVWTDSGIVTYQSKPDVYIYQGYLGGTNFKNNFNFIFEGRLVAMSDAYINGFKVNLNAELGQQYSITSNKISENNAILDITYSLIYKPLNNDQVTCFGLLPKGTMILYQVAVNNYTGVKTETALSGNVNGVKFYLTQDHKYPSLPDSPFLTTLDYFKSSYTEALADLKFQNEQFILQGFELLDERWQDLIKDMDLIHDQIWHESIPLPTPSPTTAPPPTTPPIKPPPFPFPTDFPQWETFPTSPPLDIGESIPLDPPNITSTDGTGSVTGDGLAGVLGDIGNWFSGVFSNIGKAIGSLGTGILDLLKWIGNSMVTGFNNVMGFLGSLLQSILNGVMSIVDFCTTFFKELTTWLENAISSTFDMSTWWKQVYDGVTMRFAVFKDLTALFSQISTKLGSFRCNTCVAVPSISYMDVEIIKNTPFCFGQFEGVLGVLYIFMRKFFSLSLGLGLFMYIYKRIKKIIEKGWH